MANEQDLAGLPEDVREAFEYLDHFESCPSGWTTIRAELLRLTRENAECRANERTAIQRIAQWRESSEHAEAELAALKRRIAEAPIVLCEVKDGADEDDDDIGTFYMPRAYWNVPVALLPVGGETK